MRWLLTLEAIWWILAVGACYLVIFPITSVAPLYPFLYPNALFVLAAVILFRYIFFMKYSLIARSQVVKVALIFLSIPLIFHLVSQLNQFVTTADVYDHNDYLSHLSGSKRQNLEQYIRTEMVLFGTTAIIAGLAFPVALLRSVWRQRNRPD